MSSKNKMITKTTYNNKSKYLVYIYCQFNHRILSSKLQTLRLEFIAHLRFSLTARDFSLTPRCQHIPRSSVSGMIILEQLDPDKLTQIQILFLPTYSHIMYM